MKTIFCILLNLLLSISVLANTVTAVSTEASPGDWEDGTSWAGGEAPQSGDVVMIPSGKAILLSTQVYPSASAPFLLIRIWGTLKFEPSGKLNLSLLSDVQVFLGGKIKPKNSASSQLITIGGIIKYNASNNGTINGPAIANAVSGVSVSGQPLSGFSPWALTVKFRSFSALETGSGIAVKWETEEEAGIRNFILERSMDGGRTWSVSTLITAKGMAAMYSHSDFPPPGETLIYRVKTTDYNGGSHYSSTLSIKKKLTGITVAPNPATDELQVFLPNVSIGKITATLLNSTGQPVLKKEVPSAQTNFHLSVQGFKRGLYFLIVNHNSLIEKQLVLIN